MGGLAMEEMPLSALFEQARKIHLAASESGVDQDVVKKGCEMFQKCEDMIGKLALFSSNETKEDISTNNLKYLLVPYYLADLTEKIIQEDRIQIVKASYAKLKEFFSFCEAMELVPDEELEASSRGGSGAPADRKALKIARFKRQKAAEAKLLEIKERKERRGRSTKAAALSTPVESGEDDIPDDDSEEEREAWLSSINLAVCKDGEDGFSRDALDDRTKKAETWHRDAAARVRYSNPAQPITCATFAQDVLEGRASVSEGHEHKHQPLIFGPASIVGGPLSTQRERMIAQVFQPSHSWSFVLFASVACSVRLGRYFSGWTKKSDGTPMFIYGITTADEATEFVITSLSFGIATVVVAVPFGLSIAVRLKASTTWHRDAAARVRYSNPAQPITCATFAQDVLEGRASVSEGHEHKHQPLIFGPASIVGGPLSTQRERMIAQVFQPSHRMPTMCIEDAGLTEMNIMNDWQEQTKKAIEEATTSWYSDKPLRRKEEDEEDDDEDEEAVMKARAFDDWKDDNPRGAGNKKLTPCG
ncbi:hypothetical protein ARALYDRAFT_918355 [Arabidopsis lyrata subsp. lyrata]|uniref:PP2A regulatory subunit TAP46 n=1 Tax=Arabidopsis lyrata subsp. lyrata TaxID=81972 RepID=D7MSB4_ARALL|nr:hypothetical protein ARALYDRAFT_918355 [Arabidopsis lyrata subsp. lyrata]